MLKQLTGTERLVVMLLYGAGFRLEECLELRVKDLDFDRQQITVRQGKGRKDRVTMLPTAARAPLTEHLAGVRRLHGADLAGGLGRVVLPCAVDRKYLVRSGHERQSTDEPQGVAEDGSAAIRLDFCEADAVAPTEG